MISCLSSVVKELESWTEAEEVDLANEDSTWELLAKVQRSIAQRLEAYNKLYDRQCEQLREDATLVHTLGQDQRGPSFTMETELNTTSLDRPRHRKKERGGADIPGFSYACTDFGRTHAQADDQDEAIGFICTPVATGTWHEHASRRFTLPLGEGRRNPAVLHNSSSLLRHADLVSLVEFNAGRMREHTSICKACCNETDSTAVDSCSVDTCHAMTEEAILKAKADKKHFNPSFDNNQAARVQVQPIQKHEDAKKALRDKEQARALSGSVGPKQKGNEDS
ncbi:hypothetical protein ABBQ32_012197 [Trebouxia sp. C0010 RCD-2024]